MKKQMSWILGMMWIGQLIGAGASVAQAQIQTPAGQLTSQEEQMRVTRERIDRVRTNMQQNIAENPAVGADYLRASNELIQRLDRSLTQFDRSVGEILGDFRQPSERFNQIASDTRMRPGQRASQILELDRQVDALKGQAQTRYASAMRGLYASLLGELPVDAMGRIVHTNANSAEKRAAGCAASIRHIGDVQLKSISGAVQSTFPVCIESHDSSAIPVLFAFRPEVLRRIYSVLNEGALSACQTESCRTLLAYDYFHILKELNGLNGSQTIRLGQVQGSTFSGEIQLQEISDIVSPLIPVLVLGRSLGSDCALMDQTHFSMIGEGGVEAREGGDYVEGFRSRADLQRSGATLLLHLIPIFGTMGATLLMQEGHCDAENSRDWILEQEARTRARCEEAIDSDLAGNRNEYVCQPFQNGNWTRYRRSGPDSQIHRRERYRYHVNLIRIAPLDRQLVRGQSGTARLMQLLEDLQIQRAQACVNVR